MSLRISIVVWISICAAATSAQAWDVPLDTLEARVQRQPDDSGARRAVAERLVGEGDLDAAIPHLRWLVADAPETPGVHRQLAQTLGWAGKSPEAIEAYDALLRVAPEDEEATFELARLLIWSGGAARAVRLLEPLARRQPDVAELQSLFAYALHGAKQPREALQQYDLALRLTPDDPQLLAESGALERWEGDWSVGRSRLNRALELGLEGEPAERAQEQLVGLSRAIAPRVTLSVDHATDSNGLTRTRFPSHSLVQFSPAWSAGVTITQERLSQTLPVEERPRIDAAATFVSPFLSFSPQGPFSLRASAGLQDVHSEGSSISGALEVEWKQAAPRFLRSIVRLQSDASVEGVRALGEGIRSTVLTTETYAEPRLGWGLGIGLTGILYSDDNTRFNLSSSTRVTLKRWERIELALTGGGGYENTAELYLNSDPYWTPQKLLTVLGGGVVSLTPIKGVKLEPELTVSNQRDAYASASSLGVRLRASLDRGRHRAGFLFEKWGSDVYSVQRVGLRYEVALW